MSGQMIGVFVGQPFNSPSFGVDLKAVLEYARQLKGVVDAQLFEENATFEMGAFPPPVVDANAGTCWICDHIDIAVGMNAATKHPDEARTFLEWLTTEAFAGLYTNLQPGFFSLSDHPIEVEDPLAQEFVSWRQECKSTIRLVDQYLSRGENAAGTEGWRIMGAMQQGQLTPEEAAAELQSFLWYPQ